MKKLAQPTRSFFTLKISWKSSPGWLQLVFHFGTENGEGQLKKSPCITIVFTLTFLFDMTMLMIMFLRRMVTCNLTYGPRGDGNGTKRVTHFLPKHRWENKQGRKHSSCQIIGGKNKQGRKLSFCQNIGEKKTRKKLFLLPKHRW